MAFSAATWHYFAKLYEVFIHLQNARFFTLSHEQREYRLVRLSFLDSGRDHSLRVGCPTLCLIFIVMFSSFDEYKKLCNVCVNK